MFLHVVAWKTRPQKEFIQSRADTVRIWISFIARYVYRYEELFIVTEAPQWDRMAGQDTDNKK